MTPSNKDLRKNNSEGTVWEKVKEQGGMEAFTQITLKLSLESFSYLIVVVVFLFW